MIDKPKPLVYTVGEQGGKVNICVDCYDADKGEDTDPDVIRNIPSFGDSVSYPECYICKEVARPETLSTFDAELPEWLQNA